MNAYIGHIVIAQEVAIALLQPLARLVHVLLALVGQVTPAVRVKRLVDVRIGRICVGGRSRTVSEYLHTCV